MNLTNQKNATHTITNNKQLKMYHDQYEVLNDSGKTKFVWIEPWALDIEILPNSTCMIYSEANLKAGLKL